MEAAEARMDLMESLFNQAIKKKLSQLAKKHDPDQVFELWAQIAKKNEGQDYFSGWRWTSDMTIRETLDSLEKYLNRLHELLPENPTRKTRRGKCF